MNNEVEKEYGIANMFVVEGLFSEYLPSCFKVDENLFEYILKKQ